MSIDWDQIVSGGSLVLATLSYLKARKVEKEMEIQKISNDNLGMANALGGVTSAGELARLFKQYSSAGAPKLDLCSSAVTGITAQARSERDKSGRSRLAGKWVLDAFIELEWELPSGAGKIPAIYDLYCKRKNLKKPIPKLEGE